MNKNTLNMPIEETKQYAEEWPKKRHQNLEEENATIFSKHLSYVLLNALERHVLPENLSSSELENPRVWKHQLAEQKIWSIEYQEPRLINMYKLQDLEVIKGIAKRLKENHADSESTVIEEKSNDKHHIQFFFRYHVIVLSGDIEHDRSHGQVLIIAAVNWQNGEEHKGLFSLPAIEKLIANHRKKQHADITSVLTEEGKYNALSFSFTDFIDFRNHFALHVESVSDLFQLR